jgi:hypothetical protein
MIFIELIAPDGSELVPTIDIKLTVPNLKMICMFKAENVDNPMCVS